MWIDSLRPQSRLADEVNLISDSWVLPGEVCSVCDCLLLCSENFGRGLLLQGVCLAVMLLLVFEPWRVVIAKVI